MYDLIICITGIIEREILRLFQGADCSKSVCPVLCSSHGQYGGGMCHCEEGWKGAECDIPLGDCQVPDCNQHGQCVRGSCVCNPGWKSAFCDERKLAIHIIKMLDIINASNENFNMCSEISRKIACFTFEFSYTMEKKERLKRYRERQILFHRDSFENIIRAQFASDDVAVQMCAYFSSKNGLAEVAGGNIYLEHLFLSRSVISSCLSRHH